MSSMTEDDLGEWLNKTLVELMPHTLDRSSEDIQSLMNAGEYDVAFDSILFSMQDKHGVPDRLIPIFGRIIKERDLLRRAEHPEIAERYQSVLNRAFP